MNASVSDFDLSAWMPWTSAALYVASFCLALLAIVLIVCVVAQILLARGQTPNRKLRAAHRFQIHGLLVRRTQEPDAEILHRIRNLG